MKKLLTFLFAIMALFACSEGGPDDIGRGNSNNDQPKVPEITLDATDVNFTTEGDSTIVTFTSSEDWTAEAINNRADGWCSISPTNGSQVMQKLPSRQQPTIPLTTAQRLLLSNQELLKRLSPYLKNRKMLLL